jgi:hypothetical protein
MSTAAAATTSTSTPAASSSSSRRRPRVPKLKHSQLRVLSIDVGLRNLGMAVVKLRGMDQSVYESILATPRRLLADHVEVELAENVDVLEENGCTAKNAKSIGPLKQVSFFHASMLRRSAQILDPPPDVLVVEVQDGGNATMRQVSTGIVGLFMGHFEALHRTGHITHVPQFTMIRGDMKMKICNMILNRSSEPEDGDEGEGEGEEQGEQNGEPQGEPKGEPAGAAAGAGAGAGAAGAGAGAGAAAAAKLPPEYLKRANPRKYYALLKAATEPPKAKNTAGRSRQAYEQRKKSAVLAFETYIEEQLASRPELLCESLRSTWSKATAKKKRDISDAVLQGMYILGRELKVDMGARL